MTKLKSIISELDNDYEKQGILDERLLQGYVQSASYAIFSLKEYRYARDLIK